MAVLAAHLTATPPRVSEVNGALDSRLDAPILRMLEKNPDDRAATAGEAIAELKRAAEAAGHEVPAEAPRFPRPKRLPISRGASDLAGDQGSMPGSDQLGSEQGLEREVRVRSVDAQLARLGGPLWPIALVMVLFGAGAVYFTTRATPETDTNVRGAGSTESAPPRVAAAGVEAGPMSAELPRAKPVVDLMLQGAPRGARVMLDGKAIGEAPGPVPLPAGEAPLQLTVVATGYETGRVAVIPNQATSASVTMRKRAPGPASSRESIPSDLENPF
jgi:serine/threonine-protein kinase